MSSFLLGRVIRYAGIWLLLVLTGLWVISEIPGSHGDLSEESGESTDVKPLAGLPVFYFGFLPDPPSDAASKPSYHDLLPRFSWHGTSNLFHGFLFGENISLTDQRPVADKIREALSWTLAVQLPAVLIIFAAAWYLALWSVSANRRILGSRINMVLTALHAVPVFWLASLLLAFFANPDRWALFPGLYLEDRSLGRFSVWIHQPAYFVLPVLSMVLPSLSLLYLLSLRGFEEAMSGRFWTRALASGISRSGGIRSQIVPLALIPTLGWIGSAIPFLIGGSLVVETIFSIPGMGRLMYQSVHARDWPVAYSIFLLSAAFTLAGMLLSDLMQWLLDPRVRDR